MPDEPDIVEEGTRLVGHIKVCIQCWQFIEWSSAGTLDNPYHTHCWNERNAKLAEEEE